MRAVYLDKDGTLVENLSYNIDPGKAKMLPGVEEGLQALHRAGYQLVVVSNQSGVARGLFSEADLIPIWKWLRGQFERCGVPLLDIFYCPHLPESNNPAYARDCACRKPNPGMLNEAARAYGIDLPRSWMIGDILDDVEAGHRAGCRSVLLDTGNETEWKPGVYRMPEYTAGSFMEAADYCLEHSQG